LNKVIYMLALPSMAAANYCNHGGATSDNKAYVLRSLVGRLGYATSRKRPRDVT